MEAFRKIVVATDFGDSSEHALELASDLANRYSSELVVIHVLEILVPAFPFSLTPDPVVSL